MRPTPPISRRRFHRRLLGGLGLPLAAPALTQAATAAPAPAPAAPPRHTPGSVVTLLTALEPPTLVGLVNSAAGTFLVSPKAVEGLLSYDFDLRPRAQLAVAWEVQPDGLQYTFRLRRGVKWHDGQDFTSADVAFSILALKASHPRGRATFASVAEVRTPDAHTAVLVLTKPAPFLLTALAAAESPIVAKHLYEGKDLASHPANNAPIGTGPFVFKEWVRGSHVLYERNPNYWDTRGNEYFNNSTTRIEFNLDNRYFKHAKVRQAVAHAIDRDVILKTVWYGYGVGAPGPISPVLKGFYDPNVAVPRFDRKRAEALLDEAGFPRGADGVRFRVSHDVFDGGGNRVGQYIRQALARVGIDVSVRTQEFGSYIKRVYTERDFDFNNQGMSQMFDPTVGIQRFYWSKNFRPGVPFSNGAHYDNPEVDRLLEAAAVENDAAKRRALFSEFQRVIATELPTIGLVAVAQVTVANRRIGGHTVGAEGLSGNFADIHIKTRA